MALAPASSSAVTKPAETTICAVGFPVDVPRRELKNLCRWFPGFEGAHVVEGHPSQGPTLFLKFTDHSHAQGAAEALAGLPFDVDLPQYVMRADFARRELDVRATISSSGGGSKGPQYDGGADDLMQGASVFFPGCDPTVGLPGGPSGWSSCRGPMPVANIGVQWPSLSLNYPAGVGQQLTTPPPSAAPGVKLTEKGTEYKSMAQQQGGPIDTIAILGMLDKNLSEEYLRRQFGDLPGFVTMKVNPHMGAAFAKFESRSHAEAALLATNAMGLGAEWARRNLC